MFLNQFLGMKIPFRAYVYIGRAPRRSKYEYNHIYKWYIRFYCLDFLPRRFPKASVITTDYRKLI